MDTDSYLLDFPNDEVEERFPDAETSSYLKPSSQRMPGLFQVVDVMSKGDCHQLENLMTSFLPAFLITSVVRTMSARRNVIFNTPSISY